MSSNENVHTNAINKVLAECGDNRALLWENLMPLLYPEMRRLARIQMRGKRQVSMQPTMLAHDAYMRLLAGNARFEDHDRLVWYAVRTMKHLLIDHHRAKNAQIRGDGAVQVDMDELLHKASGNLETEAMVRLSVKQLRAQNPVGAEMLRLTFLEGLTQEEAASKLKIGKTKGKEQLKMAYSVLAGLLK